MKIDGSWRVLTNTVYYTLDNLVIRTTQCIDTAHTNTVKWTNLIKSKKHWDKIVGKARRMSVHIKSYINTLGESIFCSCCCCFFLPSIPSWYRAFRKRFEKKCIFSQGSFNASFFIHSKIIANANAIAVFVRTAEQNGLFNVEIQCIIFGVA